jgi:enediyne biosynthesis protein E4
MRAVWLAVVLGGCNNREGPLGSVVTVDEGGVVTCANPGLRSGAEFAARKEGEWQPLNPPWEDVASRDAANLAGGGMVIDDLDADGFVDLFLPSEHSSHLYWGNSNAPTYDQLIDPFPGGDLSEAVGGAQADVDGDGDLDLLVTRWMKPVVLLRNDGGRQFTDITGASGLGGYSRKYQSASWGDMDADGDLDLFLGTYGVQTKIVTDPGCGDHIPDPSELWRNEGDGTFTEVSDLLPVEVHEGYVFASGWYDVDDDGLPELFVSNDDGGCAPSVVVDNHGHGSFEIIPGFHPEAHDMGMAVGDLNGDEIPDFVLTSFQRVALLQSSIGKPGEAWVDSTGGRLSVSIAEPYPAQAYGWGAEFGDVDNDTDLDLAMMFGYWSYYQGNDDPVMQADGLWIQDDQGVFTDQGSTWGTVDRTFDDPGVGRGVVIADLNNDGWLDLIKRQLDAETPMYIANCGSEGWLRLRLRDQGPNPFAVGAKVRVIAGGDKQVRWMQSGSSGMYTGSPLEVHFGLGGVDTVERIEVVWPDGEVTVTEDVAARQLVTLTRSPAPAE